MYFVNFNLFNTLNAIGNFAFQWIAGMAVAAAVFIVGLTIVSYRIPPYKSYYKYIRKHKVKKISETMLAVIGLAALTSLAVWTFMNHGEILDTVKILIGVPLFFMLFALVIAFNVIQEKGVETFLAFFAEIGLLWPMTILYWNGNYKALASSCVLFEVILFGVMYYAYSKRENETYKKSKQTIQDVKLSSIDDKTIADIVRTSSMFLTHIAKHDKKNPPTSYFKKEDQYSWQILEDFNLCAHNVRNGIAFSANKNNLADALIEIPITLFFPEEDSDDVKRENYFIDLQFKEDGHFTISVIGKDGSQIESRSVNWSSYVSANEAEKINKQISYARWKGRVTRNSVKDGD